MRREVFQTPVPPKLRIQLAAGDVRLETTDATETVVEIEGPHEDDAKILQRGDEIVVEVGKKLFGAGRSHNVRVSSPHGAGIDANVASADVTGRGRFGPVELNTASGDVSLERVEGRLSVNTASGDVDVERVGGEVKVNSASGGVTIGESESDARIRSASGDQEIRSAAGGKLELQSASGDVKVGIRRGSKAWIDATSMSGDMRSELELSDEPPAAEGPTVEVKARTMSGDVTIRRA